MNNNLTYPFIKKIIIPLLSVFLSFNTTLNAHNENQNNTTEEILNEIETNFDAAQTKKEKFNIISNKFIFEFEKNKNMINGLALAIGKGDTRRTQKFLEIVDDVNDEKLWISIYDFDVLETYTLIDVAFNAENFLYEDDFNASYSSAIIQIIQLLINKKINVKITPTEAYSTLLSLDQYQTSYKQRTIEIASLFDNEHPKIDAPFIPIERLTKPTTKTFLIMLIYEAIYGHNNLNDALYETFQTGYQKINPLILKSN